MFASLSTDVDRLPAGNSIPLCLEFLWTPLDRQAIIDDYNRLDDMAECIEIRPWVEYSEPMDEFTCAMNSGFHKQMGDRSMCYKYDVLKEVCIYVTGEYN